MERGEGSGERDAVEEENLGEKLRRGVLLVSRRREGAPSTPFRLLVFAREPIVSFSPRAANPSSSSSRYISARKLAAALWEFHHYFPLSTMHRGIVSNGSPSRLRRLKNKDDDDAGGGDGFTATDFMVDPSPGSPDQPGSASNVRNMSASLMQHHRLVERNRRPMQPFSPSSYSSSMEVTPYKAAVTPSSYLDFKGRANERHYSLKTSTELLRVLNHIMSLEEQHASNVQLIKALKTELDHARLRIKELLCDHHSEHKEIGALMKQITECKLTSKSKEQDKIHAAIRLMRDELEDEGKLRKHSESLHRKLAREISDAKSSLSNALKEVEKERKFRKLLEDLCDEFSIGIREYELEVHSLKQKSDYERAQELDHDCLILHVSESWLNERMQMKIKETENVFVDRDLFAEKLRLELERFLQAKRKSILRPRDRRKSIESVPIQKAVSATKDNAGENDSIGNDSICFEFNEHGKEDEIKIHEDIEVSVDAINGVKKIEKMRNPVKTKVGPRVRKKTRNPSSMQVKFEERMARALLGNRNKNPSRQEGEKEKVGDSISPDIGMFTHRPNEKESKNKSFESMAGEFTKNQATTTAVGEIDGGQASCSDYTIWRRGTSPMRQWTMVKSLAPDLDVLESSSKLPPALKDNTLKSKLMEARSKGQKSRFRSSKDPS
ncbi:hypothetical protein SAY87_031962 [Trapa incisa]|uniref:Uncharacterized protein n=1 Tax=Trapa incisa TaxID=236973 RepID=A0AAN7KWY4_9MYRT|nr:hypothetical protein SAY87_031962 [Trapa incisa]